MADVNLLAIKGVISELPKAEQLRVKECAERLRALVAEYPDGIGMIAMALVGYELGDGE